MKIQGLVKYAFTLLVLLHGMIHFTGYANGFEHNHLFQSTVAHARPWRFIWLSTAIFFLFCALLFWQNKKYWPALFLIACGISQTLIITVWPQAWYGTLLNALILCVALGGWFTHKFESGFKEDVQTHLHHNNYHTPLLTDAEIGFLPELIQKYIRYSGAVGKPKIKNMRLAFSGFMRGKEKDWFAFHSLQYNFFKQPARLFYMKAKMFGLTVPGYHRYQSQSATMQVKLFGIIPVMKAQGKEMDKAETVTFFNDMCLFAPAMLTDKRICWTPIDNYSAKAVFNTGNISISATLHFNEKGQLVNFISDDRYDIHDMKMYRFSTPVKEYRLIRGRHIPSYGEAIWHYPEGEFTYGKFLLKQIEYNTNHFDHTIKNHDHERD